MGGSSNLSSQNLEPLLALKKTKRKKYARTSGNAGPILFKKVREEKKHCVLPAERKRGECKKKNRRVGKLPGAGTGFFKT